MAYFDLSNARAHGYTDAQILEFLKGKYPTYDFQKALDERSITQVVDYLCSLPGVVRHNPENYKGTKGDPGLNGLPGRHGLDGKDGKDGANGKDGLQGLTGKDGKDGLQGLPGINGRHGHGLDFQWDGSKLGVKRTHEKEFTYADLTAPLGTPKDNELEDRFRWAKGGGSSNKHRILSEGTGTSLVVKSLPSVSTLKSLKAGANTTLTDDGLGTLTIASTGGGGGGGTWGSITGTLSNQTDLQAALNALQPTLTLTTTGSSGAATLSGNTLNIPQYTGGGGGASWGSITGTLSSQTDLQAALDVLVPYTGATTNVDLGSNTFNAQSITIGGGEGTGNSLDIAGSMNADYINVSTFGRIADNTGNLLGHTFNLDSATASTIAGWDSSKNLISLSTSTYPSLTELSYIKGVTSSIQTQLAAKQGTISLTTTGTSGVATLTGATLNIPNYANTTYTAGTGLGLSGTVFSIDSTVTTLTGTQTLTNKNLSSGNTFPTFNQSTTGQAGTVATISGLITAGTNVTITGSGTLGSPYSIAASGGGGGGVTSLTGDGTIISNLASTGAVTLTLANTPTGTGGIVLASAPTLSNPVVGTQAATDNSTKAASTAYVQTALLGALFGQQIITPVLANFTLVNNSSNITQTAPGGICAQQVSVNGNNLRMAMVAAPGTPYRAVGLVLPRFKGSISGSLTNGGVAFRNTTTGQVQLVCLSMNQSASATIVVASYSNNTTFNTVYGTSIPVASPPSFLWFACADDGTNVYFEYSLDGLNWIVLYTISKVSGYLGATGYNQVGFLGNFNNSSAGILEAITLASWQIFSVAP